MTTLFLLDDHELVRRGLHDLLESVEGYSVVGEAGSAATAMARIPALRPDVAILDARLPDGTGIEVCRHVRAVDPSIACLMLTSYDDAEALYSAVHAGAAGYVLKQVTGTELLDAVAVLAAGGTLIDPALVRRAAERTPAPRREVPAELRTLTAQERRILDLIAEGLTNRQIGDRMFLAEKTVKNYVSNVLAKLGLQRRAQAALLVNRLLDDRPQRVG
ncbi:response regulator [Nocardioides sp. Leaf285]|uniref:response regulator n=1 Tax=Nocardioides sp. Leaf285 TaxID=1736322 RepID=UPI000702DAAC|nr:response regulator transcription factor [Nocardioides sp. Leaf285]KQP64529.1 LuxR family transcriptional regulator [Nocardioides sp. Leaf285]